MNRVLRSLGVAALILFVAPVEAQEAAPSKDDTPVKTDGYLSSSIVRTQAEQQAVAFFASIIPKFDHDVIESVGDGTLNFAPEIKLQTGGNDTFQSLIVKGIGYWFKGKRLKEDAEGNPAPGGQKGLPIFTKGGYVFPFSGGVEADRNLKNVAALAEAGFIPVGMKPKTNSHFCWFGLECYVGIFLQAGYKFKNQAGTPSSETGGAADQSDERANSSIARVKLDGKYNVSFGRLTLSPAASAWYDIRNSEFYYHVELPFRYPLKAISDNTVLEFKYEKGSGAPNFNKGDQFGFGLAIAF